MTEEMGMITPEVQNLVTDSNISSSQPTKSCIWLQTSDGSIQQMERELAAFCPMIYHEYSHKNTGSSKNTAIHLPPRVSSYILSLVLEYCRFHQIQGRSNKERKAFDERFVRMDTKKLCELTSAADSLQMKPLVDLTSRALARIIEGRTPEEIRQIFHLPDDLTEEEKLEPLKNATDDPRIRLLNRLYAKKRKEIKEREKLKTLDAEEDHVDDRSVDDLLSFINGPNDESKPTKPPKSKKKNRRQKHHQTCTSTQTQEKISDCFTLLEAEEEDDEIDPALKAKIDREVEDFARRLNSDWPERMQELLSVGHY